ncbi:PEP-CTERM sorting domain-containing protein [Nitrogeniibacter mangrovi]|uniref:PEP-CTERM sorting domain-containing protein n=1 Tax=Nitrogeniibacter mangrovi TaxID=2016596 RepID=A0A6C1B5I1_9RHOO|nr:PEP-CTERM sorting domain-containing protein [Nitrogeniibacter mangrovi]QID18727.1 PEP-CTERM sorting domain-containing protein [Nitrogeniibacter mangrovi]
MKQVKHAMIAAAASLVVGSAFAAPVIEAGSNSIYYNNLENQYRTDAQCAAAGGCLANADAPAGYQLVDPTIAGNVMVGDVFAGVLRVQNIDHADGSSWYQSGTDQFQGYFAQEVTGLSAAGSAAAQITFGTVASDPFGILAAGEMFRFYVDGGATAFTQTTSGSVMDIINLATDGTLWASLGIAAGNNGGFAYAIDDQTAPGTATTTESYLGLNLMLLGAAYNGGTLNLINDLNESLVGGVSASQICSPAEIANPAVNCTQFVATSEIEYNSSNVLLGNGASPFIFASNDPATINRVPEPATLSILGLGLLGLAASRRRKA